MEVLLLAERARRAILAYEAFDGERIAAIMEAITWGNASALSSVFLQGAFHWAHGSSESPALHESLFLSTTMNCFR